MGRLPTLRICRRGEPFQPLFLDYLLFNAASIRVLLLLGSFLLF